MLDRFGTIYVHNSCHLLPSVPLPQLDALRDEQADLEKELEGERIRNRQYEQGVYGLPQVSAAVPVHAWCMQHATG